MMLSTMYWRASQWVKEVFRRDEGQGMVEYGLILALVAVVVIGALTLLGEQVDAIFESVSNTLSGEGG